MSKKYKRTLFRSPLSKYLEDKPQGKAKCDHPSCNLPGEHKAPKSRYDLQDYYFFCELHIAEYNRQWNYCDGMNVKEIEHMLRHDGVWGRDTKPFAKMKFYQETLERAEQKYSDFLGEKYSETNIRKEIYPKDVRQALDKLGLMIPENYKQIRNQYKLLVKKHHPDINPNQKRAEEELKSINEAYEIIKKNKNLWR